MQSAAGKSTGLEHRPGLPLRALKLAIFLAAFCVAFLIGVSSASAEEGQGPASAPASPVAAEGDSRDEDDADEDTAPESEEDGEPTPEQSPEQTSEQASEQTAEQTSEPEVEPAPEAPAESDADSGSDAPGTSETPARKQAGSRESSTGQGRSHKTSPPEETPDEAAKSVRRTVGALRTTRARALRTLERELAKPDVRNAPQHATTLVAESVGSVAGIIDPITQGLIGTGLGDVIGQPGGVVPSGSDGVADGWTGGMPSAARTPALRMPDRADGAEATAMVAASPGAHLPGAASTDLAENDSPDPSGLGLPLEAIVAAGGTTSGTAAVAVTTLAGMAGGLPSDAVRALAGPPPSVGGRPGFAPD